MKIDISTTDGYDVATALRGPDFSAPNLKEVFTARIRSACGVELSYAVSRDYPVRAQVVGLALLEVKEAQREDLCHYLAHARTACMLIGLSNLGRLADRLMSGLEIKWDEATAMANVDRLLNDVIVGEGEYQWQASN